MITFNALQTTAHSGSKAWILVLMPIFGSPGLGEPPRRFAHWEHRGVLLRIEIGPQDLQASQNLKQSRGVHACKASRHAQGTGMSSLQSKDRWRLPVCGEAGCWMKGLVSQSYIGSVCKIPPRRWFCLVMDSESPALLI